MDAATIQETNRIRLSLGMKPLPVPGAGAPSDKHSDSDPEEDRGSTLESREAEGGNNYKNYLKAESNKQRREQKAAAARRSREMAQRNLVLEGKGLGEADQGGDVDTRTWLTGQKKRQKKIDKARKLEEEFAAAEAAAAAAVQYTSKDLAGIKVAHDMSAFLDGDEQILTLKDSAIDGKDEDDELENLVVREQESLKDKLDLLKKRPAYNPLDDDEAGGGILAQYDEEISGKKRKLFTLDQDGMNAELADILGAPAEQKKQLSNVSLDDIVSATAPTSSDYLDASEIKVKKPKKKRSKQTRQKQQDEVDLFPLEPAIETNDAMDLDSKDGALKKPKVISDAFVDDDDLQASLAAKRRTALKNRKKNRPEDVSKMLKELKDGENAENQQDDGGLVVSAVSEFVSGLVVLEEEARESRRSPSSLRDTKPEQNGEDQDMEDLDDALIHQTEEAQRQQEDQGEDEEKMVGSGMGAALSLLRERGLVEESKGDEEYAAFKRRQDFLAKKKRLEEELDEQTRQQRERDRASGKLDRMSVREREEYARQQNQWRDQQQSRRMAELYEGNYKPNVQLQYHDEHGRALDTKAAFKHLSHHFHGKGSGNMKTQKLLKKMEADKRSEAQSMFDASQSAGMSRATAQQLKKRKEAGVRLG